MQDINHLPPTAKAMQSWRDLASAIYRMVGKLGYPTALGKYTIDNLMEFDPIAAKIAAISRTYRRPRSAPSPGACGAISSRTWPC